MMLNSKGVNQNTIDIMVHSLSTEVFYLRVYNRLTDKITRIGLKYNGTIQKLIIRILMKSNRHQ